MVDSASRISLTQLSSYDPHMRRGSGANFGPVVTLNDDKIRKADGFIALGIGRSSANAIQIGARNENQQERPWLKNISGNHAEILYDTKTGKIKLEDKVSKNGTIVFSKTQNKDDGLIVAPQTPIGLELKDKWEIVLAFKGKEAGEKYHPYSLVIKSEGDGNLTFHQITKDDESDNLKLGDAIYQLKLPSPNETSPQQARLAAGAGILRTESTDQPSAGN